MTLRQLLQKPESGIWQLPLVSIRDKPALPWRGLMLDVSRHFFFPKEVKHLLRTMALFKMNHFHWHLTDDQGWRFPVE
ncbi:nahA, partial [Symbiodinium necroappetens]